MSGLPKQLHIVRDFPHEGRSDEVTLRSTEDVPLEFRSVFKAFPYFNILQSSVYDTVFGSDDPVVISAPTGAGKTCVFEMAIVKLLMNDRSQLIDATESVSGGSMVRSKAIYLAPIKALCDERHTDWTKKFGEVGCTVCKFTGDSDGDDFWEVQKADLIVATPEKWDSMTRRWKDHELLLKKVKLFMIDEVHTIGDEARGATVETVVSRMKAIGKAFQLQEEQENILNRKDILPIRFVAVSATLHNISDFGEWLGSPQRLAVCHKIGDGSRPVKLQKVVLGYQAPKNCTEFRFDMSLNYKLAGVIEQYSQRKPALIFCSTRKGTIQAATTLLKNNASFIANTEQYQKLQQVANGLKDQNLRSCVLVGIGFHHAGLDMQDRSAIAQLFEEGTLPVLLCTSTLAMGVNLPAHLVIIKSTSHYVGGRNQEYSDTEIQQMMGRAGRPQFDSSAFAVIMTQSAKKPLYEKQCEGTQTIESSLHKSLIEHVNAEISLKTFYNADTMLTLIQSTFLYIRVFKNPEYYGLSKDVSVTDVHNWLETVCTDCLRSLKSEDLISGNGEYFQSTLKGSIMAKYYVAFETIRIFAKLTGNENIADLISVLSGAQEFSDAQLRMNEKLTLNTLNRSKNSPTIRFPMPGKIKNTSMKVNCLIQAILGCLTINDYSLSMDANKIFRSAARISSCLVVFTRSSRPFFALTFSAYLLDKCLRARMWYDSVYVVRQISKVGHIISTSFVAAGLDCFAKIEKSHPRELEILANRKPPFGNQVVDAVIHLPKYSVGIKQTTVSPQQDVEVTITVAMTNHQLVASQNTAGMNHAVFVLVGDADNKLVHAERLTDTSLISLGGIWNRNIKFTRAYAGDELAVHLLSETMLGLDVTSAFTPFYAGTPRPVLANSSLAGHPRTPNAPVQYRQTELRFPIRKRPSAERTDGTQKLRKMGINAASNQNPRPFRFPGQSVPRTITPHPIPATNTIRSSNNVCRPVTFGFGSVNQGHFAMQHPVPSAAQSQSMPAVSQSPVLPVRADIPRHQSRIMCQAPTGTAIPMRPPFPPPSSSLRNPLSQVSSPQPTELRRAHVPASPQPNSCFSTNLPRTATSPVVTGMVAPGTATSCLVPSITVNGSSPEARSPVFAPNTAASHPRAPVFSALPVPVSRTTRPPVRSPFFAAREIRPQPVRGDRLVQPRPPVPNISIGSTSGPSPCVRVTGFPRSPASGSRGINQSIEQIQTQSFFGSGTLLNVRNPNGILPVKDNTISSPSDRASTSYRSLFL